MLQVGLGVFLGNTTNEGGIILYAFMIFDAVMFLAQHGLWGGCVIEKPTNFCIKPIHGDFKYVMVLVTYLPLFP